MPSNQELERVCNVAGYPIYPWAADQLRVRSKKGSSSTRDDENLLYLANKNAWVRVVSSVNLEPNLLKYFSTNLQIGLTNGRSLAENFILYGGTSTYAYKSQQLNVPALGINNLEIGDLQGSKTQGMNLRSGLGAYNLTGNQETQDYGYKPIPGITSVTIDTTGRMGSLRQATINFKVWDKYQLDIMDALYFRLGFTILLEWGHAKYYDNQGRLQSSEEFMINPFQQGLTKESINIALSTNTRKSYGNYGGMLGIVTSFNFTMTQDGGYDCTIKAMSLGAVMGNYAINHTSTLSNVYYEQIKQYLDTERSKAEKEALQEIDAQRLKAIQEAKNKIQTSESNWAKLNITDKLSNLLFNTNSNTDGDFQVFREIEYVTKSGGTQSSQIPVTSTTTTEAVIRPLRTIPTNQSIDLIFDEVRLETLDTAYYISRANTLLDRFKQSSNISKSSSTEAVSGYYIKDGIIFFEQGTIEVNQKYIADKRSLQDKSAPISIVLDTDYLFNIVSNNIADIKMQSRLKSDEIKPFTNYYDRVIQEGSGFTIGSGITTSIAYTKNNITYTMAFVYPSAISDSEKEKFKNKAKILFSNPNTEYIIENIETDINTNSKITLSVVNDSNFQIILGNNVSNFADIAIIKSIQGQQLLTQNKYLQERDNAIIEAEQQANAAKTQIEKNLSNEYNAEALRATIDSESTIELMLRSLLLYGVNNMFNPELLSGPQYKNFIANLFSEGAYAPIFKKGIPGKPNYDKYTDEFFEKYMNGGLTSAERLETNFRYGNNFYLMSGENAYTIDSNGNPKLKNILRPSSGIQGSLQFVPQVDFEKLFKTVVITYGESAELKVSKKPKVSVYINLGLFFLIMNHTGIMYNKETTQKIQQGDVTTPMTYIDFNPETNFFLSSINQISIDPYKFLLPYSGNNKDYEKLFSKDIIKNGFINAAKPQIQDPNTTVVQAAPTPLFDFKNDKVSGALSLQKIKLGSGQSGYVGNLMNIMVDINYLLDDIIGSLKSSSDTNEVYFQSTIEKILTDLNKSTGNYNAFRLSYNDNSNCYIITDDQIQMNPDQQVAISHGKIVNNDDTYQIPLFGKESIARSFEIRSDISSRLASMIAIASNPGVSDQVGNSKNTSDFGVYNTGSFDRYIPMKMTDSGDKENEASSLPAIELAVNFNNVVKSIYTYSRSDENETEGNYISQDSIEKARSYYINKMARVKNSQPESVHAMIIPIKSNITMDGMAGLYPFQLYTIDERILPYRYNSSNLSSGPENLRRVAFSISKMTHTISDNQWTTSVDGFMTLLRNPTKDQSETRELTPTTIQLSVGYEQLNQAPINTSNSRTLTSEFLSELDKVCERLSCKRDDMIRVMFAESGLNPTKLGPKNKKGIPAYGLVQFTPPTYKSIGVTTYQEIPSDAIKQLAYVERYFNAISPKRSSYSNLYELYGAVFLPAILTPKNLKNDSFELKSTDLTAQQISLDNKPIRDAAGKTPGQPLTVADFKKYVNKISYNI